MDEIFHPLLTDVIKELEDLSNSGKPLVVRKWMLDDLVNVTSKDLKNT